MIYIYKGYTILFLKVGGITIGYKKNNDCKH